MHSFHQGAFAYYIEKNPHLIRSALSAINDHLFEILTKEKDMNLPQSGRISTRIIALDVNLHKLNLLL